MGQFTIVPENTFTELQMDAGILLNDFDPETPDVQDTDIICATTGGITINCTPTFSDMGEDIDNMPNNMMEMKHLDGWDCNIAFTALSISPTAIQWALGAATTAAQKVTPDADLQQTAFKPVWWVGDRADGGMVAVKLNNALSTSGLSLKTTKNGKGQLSVTITGHVSLKAQKVVPMEFYSKSKEEMAGA